MDGPVDPFYSNSNVFKSISTDSKYSNNETNSLSILVTFKKSIDLWREEAHK